MRGSMGRTAATAAAGEGIIEGTEAKEGADNAAGTDETERAAELGPTDWNGKETCRELAGRADFIWANDDDGKETATATLISFVIGQVYRNYSPFLWDLGAAEA